MPVHPDPVAFPFQPVVIIGAGRSGTNALRDALVRLEGMATWPCDEINPVWRHGNMDHPDDALPASAATAPVRGYIRRAFLRIWRDTGRPAVIVEKTCANSLRVPFVAAVLPEARFVHIVRDGVDVLASARRRWRGELEVPGLSYYLAKARYAPLTDLPRYALGAVRNRLGIQLGRRRHFDLWGPVFPGMAAMLEAPLDLRIARQWAACVEAADAALSGLGADRVLTLRYEDFAADPVAELGRSVRWLGQERTVAELEAAASAVKRGSVGKGRRGEAAIDPETAAVLAERMRSLGYQF